MSEAKGPHETIGKGTRLGVYRVVGRLGAGGMGVVYEAVHEVIGRRVAIKVVSGDEKDRRRFLREGRLAAAVRHPHAIEVTDVGIEGGIFYLVMELIEGETLDDMLARELRLDVSQIVQLALPLADALSAAHAIGVVHRDLKPSNIILARGSGDRLHPKLVDFGVSKLMDNHLDPGVTKLTVDGTLVGTPCYMSPEQFADTPVVDARSDQYSFGVLLYECASGLLPVEETAVWRQIQRVVVGDFEPLLTVQSDLPPAFCDVVDRCMATDPADRFADMYAMGAALLPFADDITARLWAKVFNDASSARPRRESPPPATPSDEGLKAPLTEPSDPYAVTAARIASDGFVGDDEPAEAVSDTDEPHRSPPSGKISRTQQMTTGSSDSVSQPARPTLQNRRRFGYALLAVAAALAIVRLVPGTGERDGGEPSALPSASANRSDVATAYGGTLRIGYATKVRDLGPYEQVQSATSNIDHILYEPLFRVTEHGEPVPWVTTLAYDSKDRSRFTLTLRDRLMFHPHPCFPERRSRPATAADLVASLHRAAHIKWLYLPIRGMADYQARRSNEMAGITALDERRVQIELTQPSVYIEDRMTWIQLIPKHDASCSKEAAAKPTGTGPFQLAKRSAHGKVELTRFQRYWQRGAKGERLPRLDGITWLPFRTVAAAVATLARGEIEAVTFRWGADSGTLLERSATGILTFTEGLQDKPLRIGNWAWKAQRFEAVMWLPAKAPYNKAKVALAVAHALDRKSIIAHFDTIDRPWGRFLNPSWLGYDPMLPPLSYDPKRARALLVEAGHPNGKGLPELLISYDKPTSGAALQIANQLRTIGIPTRLVPVALQGDDDMNSRMGKLAHMATLERVRFGRAGDEHTDLLLEVSPELALAVQAEPSRKRRGELFRQVEQALLAAPTFIPLGYNLYPATGQVFLHHERVKNAHDPVTGSLLGDTANADHPGSWFGKLYLAPKKAPTHQPK
jgi:serine/threonine-protein kinase